MDPDNDTARCRHDRTAVFTIVSRNYFHFAINLMAGVAEHLPGTRRVVAICDELAGLESPDPGIELVAVEQLGMAALDRMVVHYSILELNTAIKPSVFSWLFKDPAIDKVVYFDPDIQLFSSGEPLLQRLETADVVLTPHLTAPLDDDRHPSDLSILQSGTYNLGFLALRRSGDSLRLLDWWQQKLVRDCVVDIPRGLFTDQKWMDLVPGLFERVHVERHPGWNVAYWNLKHRAGHARCRRLPRQRPAPVLLPLLGLRPAQRLDQQAPGPLRAGRLRARDAGTVRAVRPPARAGRARAIRRPALCLCQAGRRHRAARLRAARRPQPPRLAAAPARPAHRCRRALSGLVPDRAGRRPAAADLAPGAAAVPGSGRPAGRLPRHARHAARGLPGLVCRTRRAGSRRRGRAGGRDGSHACSHGHPGGIAARRRPSPASESAAGNDARPLPCSRARAFVPHSRLHSRPCPHRHSPRHRPHAPMAAPVLPYRLAYRLAWKARHVLRPMTTLPFRQRMRAALLQRAFPPQSPSPAAPPGTPAAAPARPDGVTVIGYVKAESGVGESARATLRALATTGVPHSIVDFRVGNVSRMAEAVDEGLATGRQHAVSLFHINADQLPVARTFLGEEPFTGTYRIGYWAWELERFPEQWHGAYAHVDEIWVPSSFCQRAIAAASPVPVVVVPHAVEIPAQLAPDRARFGLRPQAVVFLAMADMMSIAGRKNPFGAVEAYAAAFADTSADVQMVVKIAHAERDAGAFARLQSLAASCPGIHLLTEAMDRPVLNALIDSVDCLVSLHRAEGFGLVIAEAMARAKVVVATGWSGNMDFMTAANSLPVDYQLVTLQADAGPYHTWRALGRAQPRRRRGQAAPGGSRRRAAPAAG